MHRRWLVGVVAVLVLAAGCAAPPDRLPSPTAQETYVDEDLPEPAPAFADHFTDPVYTDTGGEFAPFGTDEGWDLLYQWSDRRSELTGTSTVRELLAADDGEELIEVLDEPPNQGIPEPGGSIDAATIIIGTGFVLLYLTGHIDDEGKALTLRALTVMISKYGARPELVRQRDDLTSWT